MREWPSIHATHFERHGHIWTGDVPNLVAWLCFGVLCMLLPDVSTCVSSQGKVSQWFMIVSLSLSFPLVSVRMRSKFGLHTYYEFSLCMWLCVKWHGAWLYGVHRTRRDGSSFMWHQPCQRCKYTTSVDIQKMRYKKLFTHVESHTSAVSLLKSGE